MCRFQMKLREPTMIPRFVRAALFSQPLAGSDLVFEEEFIYERDKKVYI